MDLISVLKDKSLKPSEKPGIFSQLLLEKTVGIEEILLLAGTSKDPDKATLIEAVEHASLKEPQIVNKDFFLFCIRNLESKAPRVKWESARVIANSAKNFPALLQQAVVPLLANSEDPGTVVRWSAATALGEIIKLKTAVNAELIPAIEPIFNREEKNSIRKIYLAALKKAGFKI